MSYETHTWESGETITAEKLNHIEDGIADALPRWGTEPLIANVNVTTEGSDTIYTLNKTWRQMYDALASGKAVSITYDNEIGVKTIRVVSSAGYNSLERLYIVTAGLDHFGISNNFETDTEDGYPSYRDKSGELVPVVPGPGDEEAV